MDYTVIALAIFVASLVIADPLLRKIEEQMDKGIISTAAGVILIFSLVMLLLAVLLVGYLALDLYGFVGL